AVAGRPDRRARLAPDRPPRGRGSLRSHGGGRQPADPDQAPVLAGGEKLREDGPMEITTVRRGSITVIAIAGSIDGMTAGSLVSSFREQVSGGNIRIVSDFAAVDYTSSAGLRALLETVKETRQQGGHRRLAAVQPEVLRVLELSGFTHILKLFPDVEAAVASFPACGGETLPTARPAPGAPSAWARSASSWPRRP